MAKLKSELILTMLDRVSAPARAVNNALDRMQRASAVNAARMSAMRGRFIEAAGAGYVLHRALSAPINAAMDFESAMADVRKVVDFPTPKSFKEMGADIRALSLEMPMAADGIAQIVAAAGQSGLAVDELLPFAEMAAKVGVAWDASADQTGQALAKLKTALGLSVSETGLLADAINHLGNNSAASAVDILDVVSRVGAQATQFGLTADQAAAFGAAMVGAGARSEVAATSFRNMGRALTRGESATARQSAAFRALGLDANQVAKDMQTNAVGTIEDVLTRIQALPDHLRAANLTDLFGDEARALGPLISNGDLLADTLALIGDRADYAGSAQAEYAVRAKTAGNAAQLFRNRITDLAISIGDALLPALNKVLAAVGPIVTSISDLAQRFPQVTTAIVGATTAIIAFRVAAIATQFAGLFMKGALLDIGVAALTAARNIGRMTAAVALTPAIAAFKSLRAAVVGYTAAAAIAGHGTAIKALGASLLGLLSPIRLVRTAMAALKFAVIGTGIGAVLVGIALAGTWIYQNWKGVAAAFKEFGAGFMEAIAPVRPALDPIINLIKKLVGWVKRITGPVDEASASWGRLGNSAGQAVGDVVAAVVGLPGQIVAIMNEAADAIFNALISPFRKAADYIRGLGNSIKSWVPGMGGGQPTRPSPFDSNRSVDGARAGGGPVRAGGNYLIGEEGPEIFTPSRSGFVSPNEVFSRASTPSGASGATVTQHFSIVLHANTGATAEEIVGQLNRYLGSSAQAAVEGAFADGMA